MPPSDRDSGISLADLLATYSLGADLSLGQPMEHMLRSWLVASRLAERRHFDESERASLFYVNMLAWTGCVAEASAVSAWFGDDIAFRADSYEVDLAGLPLLGFMIRHVGAGGPPLRRIRLAAAFVATGGRGVEQAMMSHCLSAAHLAGQLGLGTDVREALLQAFTRWDGKGMPEGVGGEEIALPVRLLHVADIVASFRRAHGPDAAIDVARERRGTQFDPNVVDELAAGAPEILAGLDEDLDWVSLLAAEPPLRAHLTEAELDSALEALGDFTDLRSPNFAGHSRGVAALAAEAARLTGLPEADVADVRRAGFVHDLGRSGIPASIWDKPGPLNGPEWERVRLHAYYTERMLSRPPALARLGALASCHHERVDGSGYHRGLSGPVLTAGARILACADTFHAMTEPRAHRPALTPREAASELRAGVRAGRFGEEAADAVLAAAGQRAGKRRAGPAGLTPREVEVLTLLARGASNRQMARTLGISPKTVATHVERIYTKIDVQTRSTATLFAMRHGLLDSLEPVDL